MKWLGAILLVGGCGSIGWMHTAALSRRIGLLEQICGLVRRIRTELLQRSTPLPELLEQLDLPELHALAFQLRQGMSVRAAAGPLLEHLAQQGLPETARTLSRLTALLGVYDSCTQASACDQALQELEEQLHTRREELSEKGKMYRTVPMAFGLMAALAVL